MAVSKTLTANGSHGHHKFTLTVTETATSVANNTSTVSIVFKLSPINTGWDWEDYDNNPPSGTVKVNGTSYSWSLSDYNGSSTITLVNKTQTVTHSSDGSKSISLSFSCSSLSDNYLPGSASASGTLALTKIARASSFSVSKGTLGTTQTISVTKQNSNYTHTITAKAGSYSQTVCTKSSSTSVSWTPALTLAQANTTGTSVSVTLTLQTYSGSTAIGDAVTKTVSMTIPTSVASVLNTLTLSDAATLSDGTTFLTKFSGYVQGKSKVKGVLAVNNGSAQGATVKKAEMSANGDTYSSSTAATSYTFTSGILNTVGSNTVTAKITDTRGRTSSKSSTITVLSYSKPEIAVFSVGRCTSTGADDDNGDYCKIRYKINYTELTNNNATIKITYHSNAEPDTEMTALAETAVVNGQETTAAVFAANSSKSFVITATVKDTAESTVMKVVPLSTGATIMDVGDDGDRLGIGKVAERAGLDVGWDLWVKDVDMTLSDTEYNEVKPSGSTGKRLYTVLKGLVDKIANKVDKVSGKGLSTNDYTTEEKDKLAGIGTILGAVNGSTSIANKSVAGDDSTVNLGSFTVPPGVWIVKVFLRWNNNSTGNRMVWISDSASGDAYSVWNQIKVPASPTGYTYVELVTFLQPTASKTFYVNAGQNSGKALTVATRWGAIRVA